MSKIWGVLQSQPTGENWAYCLVKIDYVEPQEDEATFDSHQEYAHLYIEEERQEYFHEFFHTDTLNDADLSEQSEEGLIELEVHSTFSTVKQQILAYSQGQIWPSTEMPEKYEVSYGTVVLENYWGHSIRVGVSKYGWLLLPEDDEKYDTLQDYFSQASDPDDPDELAIAFCIPEWTEWDRGELIPDKIAEQLLKQWLARGTLGL